MTAELRDLREEEFPAAAEAPFFDAASFGLVPRRTVEAVRALTEARTRPGGFDEDDLGRILARTRAAAARLIGADVEEITLAPNTSFGVNLAAHLVASGPPGRIVVSDGEFPANVLPWLRLESEGFTVERVPTGPHGRPDETRLAERLTGDDVRAFALSAVQFATGHRADLQAFGRVCSEHDVLFCVDAIQALGAVPLDVDRARIDVLACGGQKWLCAPWGSGFAYVAARHRDAFDPPMVSWLSMEDAVDFDLLLDYRFRFFPDGRKFELGTLGVQDYLGLAHSIELLLDAGVERIRSHLLRVQRPLFDWIDRTDGARAVTPCESDRRAGIVAFTTPRQETVASALREAGFRFGQREGAIRVAPHLYNTVAEMERLVRVVSGVVE